MIRRAYVIVERRNPIWPQFPPAILLILVQLHSGFKKLQANHGGHYYFEMYLAQAIQSEDRLGSVVSIKEISINPLGRNIGRDGCD